MRQLIFIHGGSAYSDYDAFLNYLRTAELRSPAEDKPKRWSDGLRAALTPDWQVITPSMPNKENAKYAEWKLWFERHLALVTDEVVLIGWSQGGYFLAKYLTENEPTIRIRATLLVAAPFEPADFDGEDGGDFAFATSHLSQFGARAGEVHIFHSEDDFIVPFEHARQYQKALPTATLHTFTDRNHFLQPEFPELIEIIRNDL